MEKKPKFSPTNRPSKYSLEKEFTAVLELRNYLNNYDYSRWGSKKKFHNWGRREVSVQYDKHLMMFAYNCGVAWHIEDTQLYKIVEQKIISLRD